MGQLERKGKISFLDYPQELAAEIDTIEVTYIAWACACANWLPTSYLEDPDYEVSENDEDCVFLEAEKKELKIPAKYYSGGNNRIRLIGRFYKDKGISKDYEQPTSERPTKARVFKYAKIEILKP